MTQRVKQAVLTLALTLPLAVTAWMAGPFATTTSAQAGPRMVGPRFPILIDTDGNGAPSPADAPTSTQIVNTTTLRLNTPFSCDGVSGTTLTFSGSDAGRYTTVSRTSGLRTQALSVSGGARASRLQFTETTGSATTEQAAVALVDANGDGAVETLSVSGTVNTMISLVFTPDSSYTSIPATQAAVIGASGRTCAAIPQVWVPLTDTNGDGRGDAIVFDLDANGIADSFLWASPMLGAAQVPATNTIGLLILTIVLGAISMWYLGKRRDGTLTA